MILGQGVDSLKREKGLRFKIFLVFNLGYFWWSTFPRPFFSLGVKIFKKPPKTVFFKKGYIKKGLIFLLISKNKLFFKKEKNWGTPKFQTPNFRCLGPKRGKKFQGQTFFFLEKGFNGVFFPKIFF